MMENWIMALARQPQELCDLKNPVVHRPPEERYYADPFLIDYHNETHLFFEDYDYHKGVISCSKVNSDLSLSSPQVVLERPYHLSYPMVFSWRNEFYMIPETQQNNTIEIYIAADFPCKWEWFATPFHGLKAADVTVFIEMKDQMAWMFASINSWENVTVFRSSDICIWEKHFSGTFKHSRSAGGIFPYRNRLIRPTQNCDKTYGHSIILKEITFGVNRYEETVCTTIEPSWYPGLKGTHTINMTEKLIVVDGKTSEEDEEE